MTDVANLQDHMAYSCQCGCVDFNLLKSGNIECAFCGEKISDSTWGLEVTSNQKPVAWRWGVPQLKNGKYEWRYSVNQTRPDAIPLYTRPQPAAWVGLTDEETIAIELSLRIPTGYRDAYDLSLRDFARTIEAALRSKNT